MIDIKALYLLQQRADIYADAFEKLTEGILVEMQNTKDTTTRLNLQKLLIEIHPHINQLQENIAEYQKYVKK